MSDIEAVKQRADIVDIIGQFVPLQRAGRTFKAPCPFHQEKTPSFVVNPDRQTWYCFGACATGGDVFQFLMKRENLSFGEALRQLAGQLGIELEHGGGAPREDYARLIEANEAAAAFFRQQLRAAPAAEAARAYLQRRGVDAATEETFGLGYSPDTFDALRLHLTGRGFTQEELLRAGLLGEREERAYDRFRDRLIFPIRDERGRCIGFGGRVLGDALPKYLNSPQTPLFDKSGTLYALDLAKDAIRTAKSAVVVEGYMDVIAAHQFGIGNVVATLGTALTERHVQILKRYTPRVTLAMDADAAGIEAAMRGDEVVRRAGLTDPDAPTEAVVNWKGLVGLHAVSPVEVRVFTVPSGKDPDEAIRADPTAFSALAEQAVPPFEFRLRHELARTDRTNPRAMLDLADRLGPVIEGISDRALQAHYLSQLATATGAREDDLRDRLRAGGGPVSQNGRATAPAAPTTAMPLRERADRTPVAPSSGPVSARNRQERYLVRLLFQFPTLRTDGMLIEESLFSDAANRHLFQVWRGTPDASAVPALLDAEMAAHLSDVLRERMPPFDDAKGRLALLDIVARMRLQQMDDRKRLGVATLHEAEATADAREVASLAHSFLTGAESLPDSGADALAAYHALTDLNVGMELHRLEAALRRGDAATPQVPTA